MRFFALIFVISVLVPGMPLAAATRTTVNAYGEKIVRTFKAGQLVKEEHFLKRRRGMRLRIPATERFVLVLHFPGGKTVTDLYRRRARLRRTTRFASGLESVDSYKNGKRVTRVLRYPRGQVLSIRYRPNGKKLSETALRRNGTKIEIFYDALGRKTLQKSRVPKGDQREKRFRNGVPFIEHVLTPKGTKITIRYDTQGHRASRLFEPQSGKEVQKQEFFDKGKLTYTRYFHSSGMEVDFFPHIRSTKKLVVHAQQACDCAPRFVKETVFEEELFVTKKGRLLIQCIPAFVFRFEVRVGGKPVLRTRYRKRILRRRWKQGIAGEYTGSTLEEQYDEYGKMLRGIRTWPDGRKQVIESEHTYVRISTYRTGKLVRKERRYHNGDRETYDYRNGRLHKRVLLSKDSHLFKVEYLYKEKQLTRKLQYYEDGRLVISRYNTAGKRVGLYWRRWKKK